MGWYWEWNWTGLLVAGAASLLLRVVDLPLGYRVALYPVLIVAFSLKRTDDVS